MSGHSVGPFSPHCLPLCCLAGEGFACTGAVDVTSLPCNNATALWCSGVCSVDFLPSEPQLVFIPA